MAKFTDDSVELTPALESYCKKSNIRVKPCGSHGLVEFSGSKASLEKLLKDQWGDAAEDYMDMIEESKGDMGFLQTIIVKEDQIKLVDGTKKPVKFDKKSIKAALLGDTSYVATVDESVVIVADEEADDVSISVNDNHADSGTIKEIDEMISDFMRKCQTTESLVQEATVLTGNESLKELNAMLDAAKKGIALINKLKTKADRKKHASEVFKNMNRIRTVLLKLIEETPN